MVSGGDLNACTVPGAKVPVSNARGFFVVIAIISAALTAAACVMIYMRRHVQVVRVRRPWTVVLTAVTFGVVTIISCVKAADYVAQGGALSCTGYWYSYAILNSIIFTSLIIRCWIVIFMFNLNQSYASFARRRTTVKDDDINSMTQQPRGHNWYFENSKLLKSRFMFGIIIATSSIFIITVSIAFVIFKTGLSSGAKTSDIVLVNPTDTSGSCGCLNDYAAYIFVDLFVGVFVVGAMVLMLRQLNDVTENFFLKEEIYNIGKLVVGIGLFVTILFNFLKKKLDALDPTITLIVHILIRFFGPNIMLLWITAGKTIHLSYIWEKVEDNRKLEDGNILSKLIPLKPTLNEMREEMFNMLFDEEGFRQFQQFLVKEFSVENILFWKEAKEFREFARRVETGELQPSENVSMDQLWAKVDEKGRNVYKSYCSDEAVLLINLPFAIQNKLKHIFAAGENDGPLKRGASTRFRGQSASHKNVNAPVVAQAVEMSVKPKRRIHSDVFAEAMTEITNLMCSDSFRRFRMLDEYREYVLERHHKSAGSGTVNLDLRGHMVASVPEGEM